MELKSTAVGQHLAQHPYNKVRMLNAGVEVSGPKHMMAIPFNQLLAVRCKRGLVWGELEFELPEEKVVRLHGTQWQETQRFYHHLMAVWRQWDAGMETITASLLSDRERAIEALLAQGRWLTQEDLAQVLTDIRTTLSSIPLPQERLSEFSSCRDFYEACQRWLSHGEEKVEKANRQWIQNMLDEHRDFFASVESQPLNSSQCRAVLSGEKNVLVLAGAGSGKTSVLAARAGWLLYRGIAREEEILLLAFGRKAAQEMNERVSRRLDASHIEAKTFHALALSIINQCSKKPPLISKLETDAVRRRDFLCAEWQAQCAEKKSQASGWRNWITQELGWPLNEEQFWKDASLAERMSARLDGWLRLMRDSGGSQADMIALAPQELKSEFQKKIRLLSPLLKAWKKALKEEGAVDFSGLLHQAISLIEKGKFISPWRHILVDEFQDISPLRAALVKALRQQSSETSLFAVGDDWQSIYRFSGAAPELTTRFNEAFGAGERCALTTTYRFGQETAEIAGEYVQQNPVQIKRRIQSEFQGEKYPIVLLPEQQLEALLNKLSGYASPDDDILVLGRYHYLKPEVLNKAPTRWPTLNVEFSTIHASKGRQADYVIVVGLKDGPDGFPAQDEEGIVERVLLPQAETFPNAQERRLLYVALTRARHRVWLLQNTDSPSVFVKQLIDMGAVVKRKP